MRRRISIRQEDRIWDLRCQGYSFDAIARIVNVDPSSCTTVLRRVRRRPPLERDPVRRGRRRGWLDDDQVSDIRHRRAAGEPLHSIARDYWMETASISCIARGITYREPSRQQRTTYPFSFANRLRAA